MENHLNIIVTYVPTLRRSKKDSKIRENFYCQVDQITSKHNKGKCLQLVLGYFSDKNGSGHGLYPGNICKYGKGHMNSDGKHLLDYAKENCLVLTNTLFPHKLAHCTIWTSLECADQHLHGDGTVGRNMYGN